MDCSVVVLRFVTTSTIDFGVLAVEPPARLGVLEGFGAAATPINNIEITATVLRMTIATLPRCSARVEAAILAAEKLHFLVARQALVIDLLLADTVTLETIRYPFEILVGRR